MKLWYVYYGYWGAVVRAETSEEAGARGKELWMNEEGWKNDDAEFVVVESELEDAYVVGWV